MTVEMTRARFDELVEEALDLVPPQFTHAMNNVVVLVSPGATDLPVAADPNALMLPSELVAALLDVAVVADEGARTIRISREGSPVRLFFSGPEAPRAEPRAAAVWRDPGRPQVLWESGSSR